MVSDKRPVCPVLVGPTAVGKTSLITALAQEHPIEVISLDSRQVYHGLRIGTAQPTPEEQAVCRHHLVDFLPPEETYDAMRYRRAFVDVYKEITARGGVPVVVGGAGMYLTALREGFMEIPGSTPEKVATIRGELDPLTDRTVRERLAKVDPAAHAAIHRNDRYRSQRALEIHELSGRPMTELKAEQEPDPALGLDYRVHVLERPVPELDERITQRTDQMLQGGWIEETRSVLEHHAPDCPGLRSLGYRQIVDWMNGRLKKDALAPEIVKVTRQYAKRQRTWFRHVECAGRGHPDSDQLAASIHSVIRSTDPPS